MSLMMRLMKRSPPANGPLLLPPASLGPRTSGRLGPAGALGTWLLLVCGAGRRARWEVAWSRRGARAAASTRAAAWTFNVHAAATQVAWQPAPALSESGSPARPALSLLRFGKFFPLAPRR